VSVPVESTVPSTSPSMISSFRNLTEPVIETPRDRRAPDGVGMNVRLAGPGTTDGSGRFVCGGSVPLRGEKRVKGCMARIVPNHSAFWKRNDSRMLFQVRETLSIFHRRAQRTSFRRRGAHQQSRLFARWNQSLRHSPNSNRPC
jgi:hypothetical protein